MILLTKNVFVNDKKKLRHRRCFVAVGVVVVHARAHVCVNPCLRARVCVRVCHVCVCARAHVHVFLTFLQCLKIELFFKSFISGMCLAYFKK